MPLLFFNDIPSLSISTLVCNVSSWAEPLFAFAWAVAASLPAVVASFWAFVIAVPCEPVVVFNAANWVADGPDVIIILPCTVKFEPSHCINLSLVPTFIRPVVYQ